MTQFKQVLTQRFLAAAMLSLSLCTASQAQNSLADAARSARAQKQAGAQPATSSAQQIADQLSEDQNTGDAPGGYKVYKAGDYRVWVPAPFTTVSHEDTGTVLMGPQTGYTNVMVLVGTSLLLPKEGDDAAFHDLAKKFSDQYSQSSSCSKEVDTGRDAVRCGVAGGMLAGHQVSGSAAFIKGPRTIAPVLCVAVSSSTARDILNDPNSSYLAKVDARSALANQEKDIRAVWSKCEIVLKSIQAIKNSAQAVTQSAAPEQPAAPAPAGNSLADVAQRLHQNPPQSVSARPAPEAQAMTQEAEVSTVPDGMKIHPFNYCKGARDCWNASIAVPTDAKLVSSDCKQYVFEAKSGATPFLLLAGQSNGCGNRAASDPNQVRWGQLVDPDTLRAPGTYALISSQGASIDGKSAVITTIRFKRNFADWIGKRAEVEINGAQVVVGCMVPKDAFPDADTICSAVISSLRLP